MIDLDELERLEAAATKGPWEMHVLDCEGTAIYQPNRGWLPVGNLPSGKPDIPDAALIVALRNAAPALFAEVRRLSAEVKRLEKSTVALSGRYGAALARAEEAESENARLRGVVEAAKAFMDGMSWAHHSWHAREDIAALRAALAAVEAATAKGA